MIRTQLLLSTTGWHLLRYFPLSIRPVVKADRPHLLQFLISEFRLRNPAELYFESVLLDD